MAYYVNKHKKTLNAAGGTRGFFVFLIALALQKLTVNTLSLLKRCALPLAF